MPGKSPGYTLAVLSICNITPERRAFMQLWSSGVPGNYTFESAEATWIGNRTIRIIAITENTRRASAGKFGLRFREIRTSNKLHSKGACLFLNIESRKALMFRINGYSDRISQ